MDLWYLFLHRAIDVVKENGLIGFITNSYFLKNEGASKLIERIKNELVLIKAVDLGDIKVFGDVSGRHIIHIYQKRKVDKMDKAVLINVSDNGLLDSIDEGNKKEILSEQIFINDKINLEIKENLSFKNCRPLAEYYDVSQGVVEATSRIGKSVGDGVFVLNNEELNHLNINSSEKLIIKKYLNSNDVGKYSIRSNSEFLIYSDGEARQKITTGVFPNLKKHLDQMQKFITSSNRPYGLHRPRELRYFDNPKLICKGMFLTPEFCYDENKHYVGFSFSVIIEKTKNFSLKYLLAILNSSLGKYWFNTNGKKRGVGVDIGVKVFRQFPVFNAKPELQKPIENLVDEMLKLNKELQMVEKGLNRWNQLNFEIQKTDNLIDRKVCELYGLNKKEIEMIKGEI